MKRKNWNFWLFFTCFRFQKKEAEISRLKIEFDKFHEEKELAIQRVRLVTWCHLQII